MMLKSKSSQSKRSPWTLLRAGLAGLAVMVGGAAVTAGCLDRPVAPAGPKTSNIYIDEIRQTSVDKIDLLFMIDNSISMADKQAILADAVPLLVSRLVTPRCVKACGKADNCSPAQEKDGLDAGGNVGADGKCAMGAPEFNPIKDIHVGVVTSSLGSHGAPVLQGTKVQNVCTLPTDDDHAHLLGSIRPMAAVPTYQNAGFLKWDVTKPAKYNPPGESNSDTFGMNFKNMVVSAGENGCGYEASLEAWYRFLIDPEPPAAVVGPADPNAIVAYNVQGVDQTVIDQRKAFLRPDSLVAVVMLSDENDCSIVDGGFGWLVARAAPMFRSTSQCATNPNDKCCQSCAESSPNAGCGPLASDPECAKSLTLPADDDLNLRCWHQKQRFGFDLLYPTARYSQGLSSSVVVKRSDGTLVQNPLFAASGGAAARDHGLVFLAGIVGVPWQDIADDDSLTGAGLRYLTEAEIEAKGRWDTILGSPNVGTNDPPVLPTDPLMIETPEDRTTMKDPATGMLVPQANPVVTGMGYALVPSSSTNPKANLINGHEQINMGNTDLQYACIFPLATPLTCDAARETAGKGCDCFDDGGTLPMFNRPLCQPPGGGAPSITQSYAKAYPGLRHLQVLKEFKDNSIVASICPKISSAADKMNNNPDYGYQPAVKAIIDRLKEALKGKCLPRPLVPATVENPNGLEVGQVPCKVIEAVLPKAGTACTCDAAQNRLDISAKPELRDAILSKLKQNQTCDQNMGTACAEYCTCELQQLSGTELKACQTDVNNPPATPGYCYINSAPNETHVPSGDPQAEAAAAELVKDCSPDSKRLLRFVGNTPTPGAIALVACLGASLASE